MTAELRDTLYNYCATTIPHFFTREMDALEKIGQYRWTLRMADSSLYNDMRDCIEDYCTDNNLDWDEEEIDIEEIFLPSE